MRCSSWCRAASLRLWLAAQVWARRLALGAPRGRGSGCHDPAGWCPRLVCPAPGSRPPPSGGPGGGLGGGRSQRGGQWGGRLYQGLRAEEAAGAGVRLLSSTSPPESPTILHLFLPSFNVSWPLQLHFLRRICMSGDADMMQHSLTKYLMELCLPENEMAHTSRPPSSPPPRCSSPSGCSSRR
jgi:hypothetical protein